MSYSVNSSKGFLGSITGLLRGDTRSLDYSSHGISGFQKVQPFYGLQKRLPVFRRVLPKKSKVSLGGPKYDED